MFNAEAEIHPVSIANIDSVVNVAKLDIAPAQASEEVELVGHSHGHEYGHKCSGHDHDHEHSHSDKPSSAGGSVTKRAKHYGNSKQKVHYKKDKERIFQHKCALEHEESFVKKQEEERIAITKLKWTAMVCFFFMICEIVGGYLSNSLAVMTDAAHTLSDLAGFMINMAAIYISQNQASLKYNMGYHRAETLGAFSSILMIWGLLIWLNIEAVHRINNPPEEIDTTIMIITSGIGLLCNIINIAQLHSHTMHGSHCNHDHGDGGHGHAKKHDHAHSHADGEACGGHDHDHDDEL